MTKGESVSLTLTLYMMTKVILGIEFQKEINPSLDQKKYLHHFLSWGEDSPGVVTYLVSC